MSDPGSLRAGDRAFSLLEMAVTLGVVALVATLVVAPLARRAAGDLTVVAQDTAQRLAVARWQAIVEGQPVSVSLEAPVPGLSVTEPPCDPRDPAGATITFAPLPAALPRTVTLTDAAGARARITIPAGLAALQVTYEDPS